MNNAEKKNKKSISAWQYEDISPVPLCKGIEIDSSVYEISENRYYTLIIKGIIVYLITAGGMGAYLTALEIEFSQIAFNLVTLLTAIICAILYHSWKSENLGYLVFFGVYASFIFMFRDYINSGFYAVMNDTVEWASIYFDTEGLQYYNERISNRYVAITIGVSVLGVASNVLLNNYILRRARYMIAIGLALGINLVAFYMEMEPNTIYTVMVLIGILMTYILKCGRHFHLSRRDHVFKRSKQGITYALDFKSLRQAFIIIGIFVLTIVAVMSTIFDKDVYDKQQIPNSDKVASREITSNVITMGIFGLLNYYPNNGGLSTGELGGVSSIRLDYQTDITVLYTPFSRDTLYIRSFIGQDYVPYNNIWNEPGGKLDRTNGYYYEKESLKKAYDEKKEHTAKGIMTVTNVEAPALSYQPYYTDGGREAVYLRKSKTYTYYPRLEGNDTAVSDYELDDAYYIVPAANKEAVKHFIKEAGIQEGDAQDVVAQIRDYYQENIPYTIRPGATPWRRDFINHFLEKNRKGYCAHFASAATLVLREMGIPARYCEGYAISFSQVIDEGELVEDAKYENYYDGYNELGETAVVRVNATDADAHAWVEIYDEKLGWTPVEVTPSSGTEEEEDDNFWDTFNNLFGDGGENEGNQNTDDNNFDMSFADDIMRYIAFAVIAILLLALLVYTGIKLAPEIKYHIDYGNAGLSDKLILKYSRFVRKLKKKNSVFRNKMNYNEQMAYLMPYSESSRNRMIDILERAGFSNVEINEEDFGFADNVLKELIEKYKKKKAN